VKTAILNRDHGRERISGAEDAGLAEVPRLEEAQSAATVPRFRRCWVVGTIVGLMQTFHGIGAGLLANAKDLSDVWKH
jgi:hypothetical protein